MSSGFNSSGFEDFAFHDSFSILGTLTAGSFRRMARSASHAFRIVRNVWRNNDTFLSIRTLLCLIATAFFGSIGISYFIITSITISILAVVICLIFILFIVLFAIYQIIIGIMHGIVSAVAAYVLSLVENTFKA